MIINKSNIHKYIIGTSLNCYNQGITSIEDISDYTPMETHTVGITHICCSYNKLTSLVGSPSQVSGMFYCYRNNLTSLEFSPDYVGGNFSCGKNNLTSLVGCPKEVGGDFYCRDNDLTDLTGLDRFNGKFYCTGNPIESIFNEVEQDFTYAFQ